MNLAVLHSIALRVAAQRTVQAAAAEAVRGIAADSEIAFARIWLVAPGDICNVCAMAGECASRVRCLHLAASGAGPQATRAADWARLDDDARRIPLGARSIGAVAAKTKSLLVSGSHLEPPWPAPADWLRSERIRTFSGHSLAFQGELFGVLGIFSRDPIDSWEHVWLERFAAEVAAAIASARENEDLRLELARLRSEVEERAAARGVHAALAAQPAALAPPTAPPSRARVESESERRARERANIEAALARAKGRIYGPSGAAALLGLKPTTLASRIKSMKIDLRKHR